MEKKAPQRLKEPDEASTCTSRLKRKKSTGAPSQRRMQHIAAPHQQVSTFDLRVAREALAKYICTTDAPLNIGEHPAHEEYVRTLCPQYQSISRVTTKNDIIEYYNKRKTALQEELKKGTFRVALTSDVWSGRANEKYLNVAVHYIDSDWVLQKRIIGFRMLDVVHTGQNISERILNVVAEYDLQNRVVAVTLDNESSNHRAIDTLRPLVSGYRNELLHQRCACNIINSIVKSGMKMINDPLNRIRFCIQYLNGTDHRVASFRRYCRRNCLPQRTFSVDMPMHWNSTYKMLEKVLEYKAIFTAWIHRELGAAYLTEEEDWAVVEAFYSVLKIFYNCIVSLSVVYTPKSHHAIHYLLEMSQCFKDHRNHPILGQVVAKMEAKFKKYWGTIPYLYSFALILDPRIKMSTLYDCLDLIGQNMEINYVQSDFKDTEKKFYEVYRAYEEEYKSEYKQPQPPEDLPTSHYSPMNATIRLFLAMRSSSSGSASQSTEVEKYLNETWVEMTVFNLNILSWWKYNQLTFPVLSRFARDVLTVPVSTVSSEAVFSSYGRKLDDRRMSQKSDMIEMLTLTKDWDQATRRTQETTKNSELLTEYFDNLYINDPPSSSSC